MRLRVDFKKVVLRLGNAPKETNIQCTAFDDSLQKGYAINVKAGRVVQGHTIRTLNYRQL